MEVDGRRLTVTELDGRRIARVRVGPVTGRSEGQARARPKART